MKFIFRHRNISSQTLFSEYRCYLNCARIKIAECATETKHWTYLYDGENPSHTNGKNKLKLGSCSRSSIFNFKGSPKHMQPQGSSSYN